MDAAPPAELHGDLVGVLPDVLLHEAISAEHITAGEYHVPASQVQPASIDLTLGSVAHRLRASFLPNDATVDAKIKELGQASVPLHDGALLEAKVPYLIPLREELDLPPWLRAKANPKSSTGRTDVFTRLLTDNGFQFDEVRPGYRGKLYLEVVSLSFPIRVSTGLSLNQLRLMVGPSTRLTDDEIRRAHEESALLYDESTGAKVPEPTISGGLLLSLELGASLKSVGFRARSHTLPLDLAAKGSLRVEDFWEPVRSEEGDRIVLAPETFYLLLSREKVSIPPHLACEMVAYDPTSGELRTHYAGFFDPGFGYLGAGQHGSRAALEVRAHDVPFFVEDGQSVCKLSFERMVSEPRLPYGAAGRSHYQGQSHTLSKHFVQDGQPPLS
ncbi:MAG: 2'-deoxycytidine 5'-triphosphate deaminase [Frankiaceae bacterium]